MLISKIVASAMAITVLTAGVAEAKEPPKAPVVAVLSDGSTIERASAGRTRIFGRTSVIDLVYQCSPKCSLVAQVTAEGPGVLGEVLNSHVLSSIASASGFVQGMKERRPDSTYMYQGGATANPTTQVCPNGICVELTQPDQDNGKG